MKHENPHRSLRYVPLCNCLRVKCFLTIDMAKIICPHIITTGFFRPFYHITNKEYDGYFPIVLVVKDSLNCWSLVLQKRLRAPVFCCSLSGLLYNEITVLVLVTFPTNPYVLMLRLVTSVARQILEMISTLSLSILWANCILYIV